MDLVDWDAKLDKNVVHRMSVKDLESLEDHSWLTDLMMDYDLRCAPDRPPYVRALLRPKHCLRTAFACECCIFEKLIHH